MTDLRELADLFSDNRLRRIGMLAVRAHVLSKEHDANMVLQRQDRVGPGATQESAHEAGAAAGRVHAEILDAFGAAQVERDDRILMAAVREGVDNDHELVLRLGHELTERDRTALAHHRANLQHVQEAARELEQLEAMGGAVTAGVSGDPAKSEDPSPVAP